MLSYAKKMHEQRRLTSINGFFMWVGRKYIYVENFITYRFRKMNQPAHQRVVSEDLAMEKGI